MRDNTTSRRWRFSLKSLILGIALLSLMLAVTHSGGQIRVMFRYSEARGGGVIYARHYGWPIPHLVVPTGIHAGKAADVFVPGLIIDLVFAVMAAVGLYVIRRIRVRALHGSTSGISAHDS